MSGLHTAMLLQALRALEAGVASRANSLESSCPATSWQMRHKAVENGGNASHLSSSQCTTWKSQMEPHSKQVCNGWSCDQ